MLRRNLLYTAGTRSKELLIMCGQESAFHEAVASESDRRQTQLMMLLTEERLTELVEDAEETVEIVTEGERTKEKNVSDQLVISETTDSEIIISEKNTEVYGSQTKPNSISTDEQVEIVNEKIDDGILTITKVIEQAIDPMIGMKDLTPYDFMK